MNMRRIECILLCLFIGILSMAAQTRTVTGSVFDKADNQPVIGATIPVMSAQGTVAHGTTTDLDGKFKLEVPSGTQNLTCRFMGYTTTTIHLQTGKDNYTVYMENDSKQLNELVVTGYQAIDRRKLTSAVTTIKMSDEIIGGVNNIDQALAGQIAAAYGCTAHVDRTDCRIVQRDLFRLTRCAGQVTHPRNGLPQRNARPALGARRHSIGGYRHPVYGRFTRHR